MIPKFINYLKITIKYYHNKIIIVMVMYKMHFDNYLPKYKKIIYFPKYINLITKYEVPEEAYPS